MKNNYTLILLLFIVTVQGQTIKGDSIFQTSIKKEKASLYEMANDSSSKEYKSSRTGSTEITRNTDFGESKLDEDFFPNISLNEEDQGGSLEELIEENRSQNRKKTISEIGIPIIILVVIASIVIVLIYKSKKKKE
jgi:hypothetical protein